MKSKDEKTGNGASAPSKKHHLGKPDGAKAPFPVFESPRVGESHRFEVVDL